MLSEEHSSHVDLELRPWRSQWPLKFAAVAKHHFRHSTPRRHSRSLLLAAQHPCPAQHPYQHSIPAGTASLLPQHPLGTTALLWHSIRIERRHVSRSARWHRSTRASRHDMRRHAHRHRARLQRHRPRAHQRRRSQGLRGRMRKQRHTRRMHTMRGVSSVEKRSRAEVPSRWDVHVRVCACMCASA